mmetsp:Transcript_7053/g.18063  ORF Transcript_7053/g.18063 Transcript_7053/m.18063 type:complete len:232 (+) Transcript_7053:64-759(+)
MPATSLRIGCRLRRFWAWPGQKLKVPHLHAHQLYMTAQRGGCLPRYGSCAVQWQIMRMNAVPNSVLRKLRGVELEEARALRRHAVHKRHAGGEARVALPLPVHPRVVDQHVGRHLHDVEVAPHDLLLRQLGEPVEVGPDCGALLLRLAPAIGAQRLLAQPHARCGHEHRILAEELRNRLWITPVHHGIHPRLRASRRSQFRKAAGKRRPPRRNHAAQAAPQAPLLRRGWQR